MIDLNVFLPPNSDLQQLTDAYNINDRGEIDGLGIPPGCSDEFICGHVFELIPCDESNGESNCRGGDDAVGVAQGETRQRPNVVVPENIRGMLRQRLGSRYHIPLQSPKR
jgi:hypothetical protein